MENLQIKTFILRHDNPISHEYAAIAAESCNNVNMSYEYFDGFCNVDAVDAYRSLNLFPIPANKKGIHSIGSSKNKAALCTASHVAIWKKIVEEKIEQTVILEHDAIMLENFNMKIPDNSIVALGYKMTDPQKYKHQVYAGKARELKNIKSHRGSHAYAISFNSANILLNGIKERHTTGCIDSHVFTSNKYRCNLNLMIVDPIVAIGWIRNSTIWNQSSKNNSNCLASFERNLVK